MDKVKQAIRAMAAEVNGGHAAMAAMLGMSKAGLQNRLYEIKGQRISIDDALMMQKMAGRTDFAEAVAQESGGIFVAMPEEMLSERDIQDAFMTLQEEAGKFVSDWRKATEDGEINEVEKASLEMRRIRICAAASSIVALTCRYFTESE